MNMLEDTRRGFIPNFCDVAVVFMLVLLVELLAILLALASPSRLGFWDRLALISLFAQWIALVNAALLCGLKEWLNRQSVVVCSLSSFSIMCLVTLAFSALVLYFGEPLGLMSFSKNIEAYYFLFRNFAISGIIYAVLLRYFYVQHQWRSNLEAQSIAQIQALKARIRPHFLFNSMNTIACLVHIDADKAEKAVEDLSDLFRASLQEGTGHTLRQEVALTGSYLDIEFLRLDDRLQVEWQLDENAMEVEVPTLCLQPLAENAIYHGIEPIDTGGKIKISAQLENNRLCLSVSNPVSEQSSMSRHEGNHMAQANIKTRLMLMYADEAEFSIKAESNMYTVLIGIPL
ncbi:MAG TPA: sensor histidine kinase [Gammaproteobacteria bacterium]|nr:sensor histidine kinase [Gammaproteobacteria bacterium]